MPYSATRAAATSSWVESGLLAQQKTSAPPALSARSRFAVSQVMCRHAPRRCPLSGSSFAKRSRMIRSTGICRSAHSIRLRPAAANPRSRTSCPLPLELGIRVLLLTKIPSVTKIPKRRRGHCNSRRRDDWRGRHGLRVHFLVGAIECTPRAVALSGCRSLRTRSAARRPYQPAPTGKGRFAPDGRNDHRRRWLCRWAVSGRAS